MSPWGSPGRWRWIGETVWRGGGDGGTRGCVNAFVSFSRQERHDTTLVRTKMCNGEKRLVDTW